METPDGRMPNASFKLSQEALKALKSGNKTEAIRIIREVTGVGLSEAQGIVGQIEKAMPKVSASVARASHTHTVLNGRPGLGPGEVPRTDGTGKWMVLIAFAALIILGALYY